MTVQTSTTVATGIGNGVTTVFPVGFKFNRDQDLLVILIETATGNIEQLTLSSDYTVQGAGNEEGGSVTTLSPVPTGKTLRAARVVDLLQLTDLRNQGKFFAEVHEDAFDLIVMMAQQQQEQLDRAVKVPVNSDTPPEALYAEFKGDIALADAAAALSVQAKNESQAIAEQFGDVASAVAITEAARDVAVAGATSASADADRAELGASSSFANAKGAATIADARALVADNETFIVYATGAETFDAYRRTSGSTQVFLGNYPNASKVIALEGKLPSMLRQAGTVAAGLEVADDGETFLVPDNGATIYESVRNLFNPATVLVDKYIATNGLSQNATGWAHSDFIKVTPGQLMSIATSTTKRDGLAFYDASKAVLGSVNTSSSNPLLVTPPAGAAFMRFNVKSTTIAQPSEIMVNRGATLPYMPFGAGVEKEIIGLLNKESLNDITESRISPNLFVPEDSVEGRLLGSSSPYTIQSAAGWSYFYIEVEEGEVFTVYSPSGQARRQGLAFFAEAIPQLGNTALSGSYTGVQSVTVTAPAGAASMVVNVKSSTVPTPDDLMIVRGSVQIPYEQGGIRLVVPRAALWPQESPSEADRALSLSFSETLGSLSSITSTSGIGRSFVALPSELVTDKPVRFNLRADSVDGVLLRDSADDIAPDHIDGGTVGANHGYLLGDCTAAAHGKVDADCGSIWANGGNNYVLADIVSTSRVLLAKQLDNDPPPTGTYTHVSGATNTANITVTAVTAEQWYPPHKNWSLRAIADGVQVEPSETAIAANKVQFVEQADILARADIIAAWIANGGIPAGYQPDGPASIAETITYEYDKRGQLTIPHDWMVLKNILVQDLMGLQFARIGTELTYIVPGALPFTYQGETVDYSMGVAADNTIASEQTITFTPARLQASGEFGHRVLVIYPDAVFAIGLLPVGDAAYDVRRDRITAYALEIRGDSGKLYFRVLDIGDHTAVAGDQYSAIGYRHVLPKSTDRTAFYAVEGGGATWVYADWHNKEGLDRLPIDEQYPELIGKSFEIVEARNVTVKAGVIAGTLSVLVDAAASSATLIMKVS